MFHSIILIIITLIISFALFILIGKYIQERFGFLKTNNFITIPLGFVVYLSATILVFTPFIFFNINGVGYVVIEILKDFLLFLFLWLNRRYIPIKKDWKWIILVIFIGFIISLIPSFIQLLNGKEAFAFTMRTDPENKKHMSETFMNILKNRPTDAMYKNYTFQINRIINSIFIYAFQIDAQMEIWWLQGITFGTVIGSIILSIWKTAISKGVWGSIVFTTTVAVLAFGFAQDKFIGTFLQNIGLIIISLLLVSFSWESIKRPRLITFIIFGITGIAGISFNPSAIWIFLVAILPTFTFYIFAKKPKATAFLGIMTLSVLFGGSLTLYSFSFITSLLGVLTALLLSLFATKITGPGNEIKIDKILIKIRVWFAPILIFCFIISSCVLWGMQEKLNPWMNFVPGESNLITVYVKIKWLQYILYAVYWIFLFIGILSSGLWIHKKPKQNMATYMVLFGTMTTIAFFSPLTATLFKIYAMKKFTYLYIQWVTVGILSLGLTLQLINKIKLFK